MRIMDSRSDEGVRSESNPGGVSGPVPSPNFGSTASNGSNKIIGRNLNGTMVVTSPPANEAELQLYRVMQRASLLAYYDTLLEMGGDDVQQLCDAGEEEFLEIMALVGMASKPLHVRRLQKALQEWVTNPALFQIPIVPKLCSADPYISCNQRMMSVPTVHPNIPRTLASPEIRPAYSPSPGINETNSNSSSALNSSPIHNTTPPVKVTSSSPAPTNTSRSYSPGCPNSSPGPLQASPSLLDVQVQKLKSAAEKLSKHLPQLEPKPQNTKKKVCKDLELVMLMPESDPKRMDEIRKYAAIYGRFDCKRKPEKPLTLHEVMVNEAAAQMCRYVPALLTRRDELFPLARQVVRHAGLHYSKHLVLPSSGTNTASPGDRDVSPESECSGASKRLRQHQDNDDSSRTSPESRGAAVNSWWTAAVKTESDDADSRCSYTSSPPPTDQEQCTQNNGVQIVAAKGDSIIAVANPALVHTRAHTAGN